MERTYTYYDVNDREINYTPEDDDLKDAIVEEMFYIYFSDKERNLFNSSQSIAVKKAFRNLTDDNDNWEDLADDFESELKEHFEEKAREEYKYRG